MKKKLKKNHVTFRDQVQKGTGLVDIYIVPKIVYDYDDDDDSGSSSCVCTIFWK